MKSLEEQILELSKLVESGRLSEKEFTSLSKKLIEESGVGLYSADSPLPSTRVPMKPVSLEKTQKSVYNPVRKVKKTSSDTTYDYQGDRDFIYWFSQFSLWLVYAYLAWLPIYFLMSH